MFKKSRAKATEPKPAKTEPAKPEAPTTAGAPTIEVRKSWDIGDYRVHLKGGDIHIEFMREDPILKYRTASPYNCAHFPKEYAAAIADALLQAS